MAGIGGAKAREALDAMSDEEIKRLLQAIEKGLRGATDKDGHRGDTNDPPTKVVVERSDAEALAGGLQGILGLLTDDEVKRVWDELEAAIEVADKETAKNPSGSQPIKVTISQKSARAIGVGLAGELAERERARLNKVVSDASKKAVSLPVDEIDRDASNQTAGNQEQICAPGSGVINSTPHLQCHACSHAYKRHGAKRVCSKCGHKIAGM